MKKFRSPIGLRTAKTAAAVLTGPFPDLRSVWNFSVGITLSTSSVVEDG